MSISGVNVIGATGYEKTISLTSSMAGAELISDSLEYEMLKKHYMELAEKVFA